FYPLTLQFDRLVLFPAIITIRHIIDERSPLRGCSMADLEKSDARFTASVVCIDTVIQAPVQSSHSYSWRNIRDAHRFVEFYQEIGDKDLVVDYALIHETEPIPGTPPASRL